MISSIDYKMPFCVLRAGYPYYERLYQAPNGVILSTTGTPYCKIVYSRDPKKCVSENSVLANLFLSTSLHYYTADSNPVVTYQFPLSLFLEYMLVYPYCHLNHWTLYYVRIYFNDTEVAGTKGWIDTTNCRQGEPSRLEVRLHVDKVK